MSMDFLEVFYPRYRVVRSCVHIHNLNPEETYVHDTQI